MPTLAEQLLVADRRDHIVARCIGLIERQVDASDPLRRMAPKSGIAVLHAIKPKVLQGVVSRLLPEFTDALEPLYRRFASTGETDFSRFPRAHSGATVAALIGGACTPLRPSAENEVHGARPGLAQIRADHLAPAAG